MSVDEKSKEPRRSESWWRSVEGVIDPFGDTGRSVLPVKAHEFILFFARQAKWPFILLLIAGGLMGAVDAGLYWALGWLIDLLDSSSPQTLIADHWEKLAGFLALLLIIRAVVIIGNTILEEQVIAPAFYQRVRWQAFRRVIEQPYEFYQNDFAGRIATKILQGGEATGDFIINVLQTMWSFLAFVVLAASILTVLDLTWRCYMSVRIFAKYYFLASLGIPPLDMRADSTERTAAMRVCGAPSCNL